jgi:putative oxidoreductase
MIAKLKNYFFSPTTTSGFAFDGALLILRLTFGLSMAFAHGLGKVPPHEKFVEVVAQMGFPLPVVFAWSAGLTEFLGGILIAIGLATRPSALFLAFTMAIAAFVAHADDPFQKKETAILYLAFSVAIMLLGSGKYAVDSFYRKSR